jgi:hypothetical protein
MSRCGGRGIKLACLPPKASGRSAPAVVDVLKEEELAFIKALSAGDISPYFYKHLMAAVRKKKRPAVSTRNRGTTVPQRASATGRQKATELACTSGSSEPSTRRWPSISTAPDPGRHGLTSRHRRPATRVPRGQADIRGCGGRACRPYMQSRPRKPSAKGSVPSEPAVSSETAPRRMSTVMSRPLSDTPVGTTTTAHVATTCVPAGQRPNKTPIFISGFADTRSFLVCLWASCPRPLTAQLKAENLWLSHQQPQ